MKAINKLIKDFGSIEIENMQSSRGNDVPNQFIIRTKMGRLFRSYDSNIAFIPKDENIIYLGKDWNYSVTTSKYRNAFLNMTSNEIKQGIDNKTIIIKKEL